MGNQAPTGPLTMMVVMAQGTSRLPGRTVTFLFSDIEGSTNLVRQLGDDWPHILDTHRQIMRAAFARHGGAEQGTEGDSFFVAFEEATEAIAAAVEAQRDLAAGPWPAGINVRVRIGLHTGDGRRSGDDYVGVDVHRAARIAAAGNGGQVLISDPTRALAERALPAGVMLRDVGRHRLKDLPDAEHLFELIIPGLLSDFPAIRSLEPAAGNVPVPLSRFVGRQAEIDDVSRLIAESRLLTLVGPGGVGKTRLMIEVARRAAREFDDGVWFVGLASITDPSQLSSAIAAAMGVRETGSRPAEAVLKDHLEPRTCLLLLDNFERLTPAAPVVGELLSASAGLTIAVTSQIPLGLSVEQIYRVPPLSLSSVEGRPDTSDAARLFIDRALRVRPDLVIPADKAASIDEICRRLDGLPLAIELAAARIGLLDIDDILARLEDRLALLSGGPLDAADRHRTLRGAIAWTYELLGPDEVVLYRRMSAFADGASLAAIEAICSGEPLGDAFSALDALVAHSLVLAEPAAAGSRFRMLETIRVFAVERLAESTEEVAVYRRHAEFYLTELERLAPRARLDPSAIDGLAPDIDDIRASVRWAMDAEERELGLRICGSAWRLWGQQGVIRAGLGWTQTFLGMPNGAGSDPFRMAALEAAGGLAYWLGDVEVSVNAYRERLALAERHGTPADIADAQFDLSFGLSNVGEAEAARQALQAASGRYAALDDAVGIARCRWVESSFDVMAQQFSAARDRLLGIIPIFRDHSDYSYLGLAIGSLAICEVVLGHLEAADALFSETLLSVRGRPSVVGLIIGLGPLATLSRVVGRAEEGARLTGAFEALSETYGVQLPTPLAQLLDMVERRYPVTDDLDPKLREILIEVGRKMTIDEVIQYVTSKFQEGGSSLDSPLASPTAV